MAAKWWLRTPEKVRKLQRTLYRKARRTRRGVHGALWDLCRRDVLEAALVAVVRNGGKPGADGITVGKSTSAGGHPG